MTIEIEGATITTGSAGVVFENAGGRLTVQNVQVSSVTSAALLSTANGGISFLQDSSIKASDLDSVTFTTAMGTQTVINTQVSGMNSVGDVFFVEGDGSMLAVAGSSISQNKIPTPGCKGVSVQSQATATVMGSTIADNTGIEFGISATLGASVIVRDSTLSGNVGVVRSRK
jgi:hypothetical protein